MDIGIIGSGQIGSILARRSDTKFGSPTRAGQNRSPRWPPRPALPRRESSTQRARRGDRQLSAEGRRRTAARPLDGSTAVVVDTGNYYAAHDGRIDAIENDLATASGLRRCSARPVVKAFNNIVAASLDSRGSPGGAPGGVYLAVAGDDP